MKKLILFFFILSFSLSFTNLDILQLALERDGKIPVMGIEVNIFYDETPIPKISLCQVIYSGNNKVRREYFAPPFFLGRVIIDDGKKKFDFDPRLRKLIISPSGFISAQEIKDKIELIKRNYKILNIGSGVIADRKVIIISLESKYTNLPVLKLWIDMENYFILRKDKYNMRGRLISQSFFTQVKYNESYPETLFRVDPNWRPNVIIDDSNLKILDTKTEKSIIEKLPLGYVLEKIYLISKEDSLTYYYRFTDGINIISLFKSITPLKEFGEPKIFGPYKVMFEESILWKSFMWRVDNWTYLLIGDIPDEKIEAFLNKIIP
jgi:negative regulator of sigma E activity